MKVPVYDNFQEAPAQGPQSNVRSLSAPDVAGSQLRASGNAMERAGAVTTSIATDLQRDLNEATTKKADNFLSEGVRTTVQDYGNLLGEDAVKAAEDVKKKLSKAVEDGAKDLTNETQRRMYQDVAQRRLQTALGQVDGHAAQQTKIFNAGQAAVRADSAEKDYIANLGNPQLAAQYKSTMMSEVAAAARSVGKGDEVQTKDLQSKALSGLHTKAIQSYIGNDDPAAARAYFAANKGEIDPRTHDEIKKTLETSEIKDKSLRLFLGMQGKPYTEQIDVANAQFAKGTITAEEHDALMTRVDHAEGQRAKRETDAKNAQLGAAQEWILQNPGQSILEMPNYNWAKQNGQLAALQNFARTGGDPITDSALYYDLRLAAADPARQAQFVGMDLNGMRASLSRTDFNSIVALQAAVKGNNAKEMEANATAARVIKLVGGELAAARLDPTPGLKGNAADEFVVFKNALFREVDARTKAKGSPLTDDEARKVGLDLLKEGRLQGSGTFFDDKVRRYEAAPDAKTPFIATPYSEIPDIQREKIESYVRAHAKELGLEPGDETFRSYRNSNWKNAVERIYQQAVDTGAAE